MSVHGIRVLLILVWRTGKTFSCLAAITSDTNNYNSIFPTTGHKANLEKHQLQPLKQFTCSTNHAAMTHSQFEGVVSTEMLARLKKRGIADAADTSFAKPAYSQRNELTWFSLPAFGKRRRERLDLRRYQMAFEQALWSEGNDYLSHVVTQEGNNWKSGNN